MSQRYKIEITPLKRDDAYGDTFDVSQYVEKGSIGQLRIGVDDTDYDVGVFNLGYIDITFLNDTGKFSDGSHYSTLFVYSRDRAKVDVTHVADDGTETLFFTGFVNDEFTRQDAEKREVRLRVLSKDSIFRKIFVQTGTIQGGQKVSEMLTSLLNRPSVTNFLTYNPSNINLAFDPTIDVVTDIENVSMRETLNNLMICSGSVLYVDRSDNIIVKDRAELSGIDYFHFYGAGDRFERTNFHNIINYNTGLQRAFNSFNIGETNVRNNSAISVFQLREKELAIESLITNITTRETILNYYVSNFSIPKREFKLLCRTADIASLYVFDPCTVSYEGKSRTYNQEDVAFYDEAEYDEDYYTVELSTQEIPDNIGFKIIGIETIADEFISIVKMREIGTTSADSQLNYWEDEDSSILVNDEFNRVFFEV